MGQKVVDGYKGRERGQEKDKFRKRLHCWGKKRERKSEKKEGEKKKARKQD